MKTHEYTDDQIQTAIDAAFPQAGPSYLANLDTLPDTHCWPAEAPNRLAIGKAFLAALSKPEASAEPTESWANADNAKAFQEFQAEIEAVWEAKDSPWTPKPGDVVRLKSGGPAMTIERFDAQASEAFCVMAYAGGVYRGVFQVATIELANP